jgi:hypothetical protein
MEPAKEKIVRNLQQAVERLHDDIARVELWTEALGCFAQPVPSYDPEQGNLNQFMLSASCEGRHGLADARSGSEDGAEVEGRAQKPNAGRSR